MEKLQLKHISPYLPYGLKCQLKRLGVFNLDEEYPIQHNDICEITNLVKINNDWEVEISGSGDCSFGLIGLDEIDVFLRPLSDLYKEIDGKVGIVEIARDMGLKFNRYDLGSSCVDLYLIDRKGKKSRFWYDGFKTSDFCLTIYGYGKINQLIGFTYLFSHHYDVFSLISQNLAIDKNSISHE